MTVRALIHGLAVLPLIAVWSPALAREAPPPPKQDLRSTVPMPGLSAAPVAGVQFAQVSDQRTLQLEEQVRVLNGRVEELNFIILQMQEQMRKQQEDNEFRIQQIEQKLSGTSGGEQPVAETGDAGSPVRGTPPRQIGTLSVENPNDTAMTGGGIDWSTDKVTGQAAGNTDSTIVAALPSTDDPVELYRNSYQFILSGDYPTAEAGFRDYVTRFPDRAQAADAKFWLGEALIGQEKYREASQVLLEASKTHAQSKRAPDMMLKLGVSLAALGSKDIACATFAAIPGRYPDVSAALKERIGQEQAFAGC